ncbi:MAG TPA: glycerol-3-phosphate 1-O-acyltransferase PlsY [Gemmatimonadales bacterium]|jgi:glycerol-3-phosphate acyltransferase PlsY|nr:glycerol-3-phosphate 1-O-acyltransferase PlsY [Gemmatimonadales bacterium]
MQLALWLFASYLLGAIPTSYLVVRLVKGEDLRRLGSGNLGATNLYRTLGWRYAIPVAVFDLLKGAVPVKVFGPLAGDGTLIPLLLGIAAFLGHVFSVFLRFRGGKGVATGAGIVLGLAPGAFLLALSAWVLILAFSGYVSLASIVAALLLPPAVYVLEPARRPLLWLFVVLAILIVFFHRANIKRLLSGTEHRFGRHATARS